MSLISVEFHFGVFNADRFCVEIRGGYSAVETAAVYAQVLLAAEKVRRQNVWSFPKSAILNVTTLKDMGTLIFDDGVIAEARVIRHQHNADIAAISRLKQEYVAPGDISWDYVCKGPYPALRHQQTMYKACMETEACGILSDAGTCKTASYLWAIDKRLGQGLIKKALVITLAQLRENVCREAALQTPGLRCIAVTSTKQMHKVWDHLDDYDVVVSAYESQRLLMADAPKDVYDMVVLDEAHRLGDPKSQQTQSVMSMFKSARYRNVVTGSLNANNELSFYMPWLFLGSDKVDISTYDGFRAEYMRCVDPNGRVWVPKAHARNTVQRLIGEFGIGFKKSACLDLPGVVEYVRTFKMDREQRRAHDELKKDMVTSFDKMCSKCTGMTETGVCPRACGDQVMIQHVLVVSAKLRQIACGFYHVTIDSVDDDGCDHHDTEVITVGGTPRLACLDSILDEIGDNRVIIWAHHVYNIKLIVEHLKAKGRRPLAVYGQVNALDAVDRFQTGDYTDFVAIPTKAGVGLNIQFSCYNIWYTDFYSWLQYDQAVARQDRKGQLNKVTTYHIQAEDSIDEAIYETIKRKGELSDYLGQTSVMWKKYTGEKTADEKISIQA